MYQIFGISKCLGPFALLTGVISLVWWWLHVPTSPSGYWSIISGSVTIASILVFIVGQTGLFPIVCRWPLVRNFFPDLDGEWIGLIDSNWAQIQARNDQNALVQPTTPVAAKITIIARLFFIRINLESLNKYSSSKTVVVKISKDDEDKTISLKYVYENTTLMPQATDSARHQGAACLDLKKDDTGVDILEGVYWTNRNWHNALNTAGKITLRRK